MPFFCLFAAWPTTTITAFIELVHNSTSVPFFQHFVLFGLFDRVIEVVARDYFFGLECGR